MLFVEKNLYKHEKTIQAYVIQEIGWEYDDSNYYRGESGGGFPTKVFIDEKIAKKELFNLKLKDYAQNNIRDYQSEAEYAFTSLDAINDILVQANAKPFLQDGGNQYPDIKKLWDDYADMANLFSTLRPDLKEAFVKCCTIDFHELIEVELIQ